MHACSVACSPKIVVVGRLKAKNDHLLQRFYLSFKDTCVRQKEDIQLNSCNVLTVHVHLLSLGSTVHDGEGKNPPEECEPLSLRV